MIRCRGIYKNIRMPLLRKMLKAKDHYTRNWCQESFEWSSWVSEDIINEQHRLMNIFEKLTKIKTKDMGIIHHSISHVPSHYDGEHTKPQTWLYVIDCAKECYLIEEDQVVLLKPYHLYTLNNTNYHSVALSEKCHKRLQCLTIDHLLE